jgi:hypothetical protein
MAEKVLNDLRDFSRRLVFGRVHARKYNRNGRTSEKKVNGGTGYSPVRFKPSTRLDSKNIPAGRP